MPWTAKAKAELSQGNRQDLKSVLAAYLRADVHAALNQLATEAETPEVREKWRALVRAVGDLSV